MGFMRTLTYKYILCFVWISSIPNYSLSFIHFPSHFYLSVLYLLLCQKYIHNFLYLYEIKDPELRKICTICLLSSELIHIKI